MKGGWAGWQKVSNAWICSIGSLGSFEEFKQGSCSVMSDFLQPPGRVAHHTPLSLGFSQQKYWNGLPFHSPGIFPT